MRFIILLLALCLFNHPLYSGNQQSEPYKTVFHTQQATGWTNDRRPIIHRDDPSLVAFFPNGSNGYFLVRKQPGNFSNSHEISWYNNQNQQQGKLTVSLPKGYSLPQVCAFQNKAVSVSVDDARLKWWDNTGRLLHQAALTKNYPFNSENILLMQTTSNLSVILNGLTLFPAGTPASQLIARSGNNHILFKKIYPGAYIRSIGLSPSGRYFAVCLYTQNPLRFRSLLLDSKGAVVFEKAQRTRSFLFDSSETRLAALDKNAVSLTDIANRQQIAFYKIRQANRIIVAAAFNRSDDLALQSGAVTINKSHLFPWAYVSNRIIEMTSSGDITRDIPLNGVRVINPFLQYKAGHLYVGHTKGLLEINPKTSK